MAHDDQTNWYPSPSGPDGLEGSFPVSSLALRVVSVLKERQTGQRPDARSFVSTLLEQRITCRSGFDPQGMLHEMRCAQVSDEDTVDTYIPLTARSIGEKWVRDDLSFAEVTIASARLQSLLAEISHGDSLYSVPSHSPARMLVAVCDGDQHTLGGFVIAAQLRRQGLVVDTVCAEDDSAIAAQIMRGDYKSVLFSCSRSAGLVSVAEIVAHVRRQLAVAPLFALGGIVLDHSDGIEEQTGVDLVSNDPMSVLALCEQMAVGRLAMEV